jgi:hypothetical protein
MDLEVKSEQTFTSMLLSSSRKLLKPSLDLCLT